MSTKKEVKKSTTIFSTVLTVLVNRVDHVAGSVYKASCTHFDQYQSFGVDVLFDGVQPPNAGEYYLLMDFVPQNSEAGEHVHRLLVNARSRVIPTTKDASVNQFIANGRLARDGEHREGTSARGPWKLTSYAVYVSYWNPSSKTVEDVSFNCTHSRVHLPGLVSGDHVIAKGKLVENTSKDGLRYWNVQVFETNYGSKKLAAK